MGGRRKDGKNLLELCFSPNILPEITDFSMINKNFNHASPLDLINMISSIINYIDEAIGILDLEGNYIFLNKNFSRTFKCIDINTNIEKINDNRFLWDEMRFLLEERDSWIGNVVKKYSNEWNKEFNVSYLLVKNDDNLPVAVIEKVIDREKQGDSLEQLVKFANIGKLTAGVIHEIKNQIHIIMGYSELILNYDETINADTLTKIEKIFSSTKNCSELITNFLSFAKKKKLKTIETDLNLLILNTVELKKYDLRIKNISLKTNLEEHIPFVLVAPSKIQQVLLNLLNNAEESLTNNGVMEITSSFADNNAYVEVIDNGKGISKDIKKNLFSPFITSKTGSKGTGLGLSISKEIIEEFKGELYYDDKFKDGTKFVFTLPTVKT